MKLNLQFFGGRGSGGGRRMESSGSAESEPIGTVKTMGKDWEYKKTGENTWKAKHNGKLEKGTRTDADMNWVLKGKRTTGKENLVTSKSFSSPKEAVKSLKESFGDFKPKRTKSTADERNRQELARVQRENRLSGAADLKKGETYSIKWGKGERTAKYVGGEVINGIAVRKFRDSKGKTLIVDNDDVKRNVKKK